MANILRLALEGPCSDRAATTVPLGADVHHMPGYRRRCRDYRLPAHRGAADGVTSRAVGAGAIEASKFRGPAPSSLTRLAWKLTQRPRPAMGHHCGATCSLQSGEEWNQADLKL